MINNVLFIAAKLLINPTIYVMKSNSNFTDTFKQYQNQWTNQKH
jgi:hypothetical protein